MIEGAPIGMSFTFHDTYYRSHDSTYGKVSTTHTAMVLMSTVETNYLRALAREVGAHAWLAKPFAPEQLLAIISILLDR